MAAWYDKYMSIYDQSFSEVPKDFMNGIKERLLKLQSNNPIASIVIIAYNEEKHLPACLWSISEMQCKYPVEFIGVDNVSKDRTAEVFQQSGIPYYTEYQQSCGYARQCGLNHAKGKYYICIDADTMYPPHYIELMIEELMKPGVSVVATLWSFFPNEHFSKLKLKMFEFCRDCYLRLQTINRPELSVRGMALAFVTEYAKKEGFRVELIRGEDGSMALALKKYGKIKFVYDKRCRVVTSYSSFKEKSLTQAIWNRFKHSGILRLFSKTDHYEDTEDNLRK